MSQYLTFPNIDVRTIKVTLKKPKTDKQVKWTSETVDNEHLNRKKSKCIKVFKRLSSSSNIGYFLGCCIYEKPRVFGESSSEDEGECENCFGHVEMKKKNKKPPSPEPPETPSPT
ncbi:E3 ubiquitin-protein ligase PPP1R11-like [Cimex lectularius]|uniref:E3 ubiquitin-protein ligase PPP1R11 n=1 Tax=Cimex lectularius TaxID=79782 RepID=A0A8I6SIB2_CIMLE|nr:E3 ubiquitin-protein ligase PPP1R11-like [Cimex lectularius]